MKLHWIKVSPVSLNSLFKLDYDMADSISHAKSAWVSVSVSVPGYSPFDFMLLRFDDSSYAAYWAPSVGHNYIWNRVAVASSLAECRKRVVEGLRYV